MDREFPYLDHKFPIAFAHRGGALDAPENSMAAFQSAIDIGYRYLETDVHLLSELLSSFPEARFNIDPKNDQVSRALAKVIKQTASTSRVCVSSFSDRRNQEISRLVGKDLCIGIGPSGIARIRLGRLTNSSTVLNGQCVQVPVSMKGVPLITETFVNRVHSLGKVVHAWTINEPSEMNRLLDLGVDGIMTDRPKILKNVLMQRNQWF